MKKFLSLFVVLGFLISCGSDDGPSGPTTPVPVANFSASSTNIVAGSTVDFSSTSQNATSYAWTFQEGTPENSTSENPSVQYTAPGNYTVTLKVTNSAGEDTETKSGYITVTAAAVTPVADFTVSNTTPETGEGVTFTDASTNSPTSWAWEFEGATPATSTAQNPQVQYAAAGTYTAKLTASNAAGSDAETKTDFITVTVPSTPPVAAFSASSTTIDRTESVTFTDATTNSPTSWAWEFEGGTPATSTDQNPVVAYNTAGTFNVTLTATNADGSDAELKTDYITVNALSASYTVTFRGNWTSTNHPTDFPSNDHFSSAVGMVHNSNVALFQEGQLASAGMENMAENGANGGIQSEVNAMVTAGNALEYINGGGLSEGNSQRSFTINVTEDHSLVTIVSMIAPSPDWFVGVENIDLFSGGSFVNSLTINAGSYDSGTDSGTTYNSANSDTSPAVNIFKITQAPLGNGTTVDPPAAIFEFMKN